ncbi:MAG: asparagine synthase-related protein [Oscillospiraceae bacterium]
MTLEQFFAENREVAVAFSGGVDSAYLLYAATRYAARVKAYYVSTAFQPEFELADAWRLAADWARICRCCMWMFL